MFFLFTLASTIGYGDYTPQTQSGRFVSLVMGILTIPLAVYTYKKMSNFLFNLLMHIVLQKSGEIRTAFEVFDQDRSGFISISELKSAIHKVGLTHISDAELLRIMKIYDVNGDNQLSLEEFTQIAINFDVDIAGVAIERFKARAIALILTIWTLIFSLWFAVIHQLSFIDGIWFCFSTFTTVGFGDIVPHKDSRWATMFLSFFGLGFMAMVIETVVTTIRRNMERRRNEEECEAHEKIEESIHVRTHITI